MAIIFRDGFESGDLSGYDLSAANGVAESSGTRPHSGALGVRVHPTASDSRVQKTGFSNSVLVARIWLNDDVSQNVAQKVLGINGGANRDVFIQCLASPHRFALRGNVGAGDVTFVDPGGGGYANDTWNKVELAADRSADPWSIRWAVNGVEQTSWAPAGGGAGTWANVNFGTWGFSMTFDTYFDDFAIADSMADFQITEVRTYKRLTGPAQLSGTAATLFTASTRTRILHIHASNPSASPVDLNLSIGTDATATRVYDDYEIAPDSVEHNYDPYDLAAGEIIQGWASTAGTVVLTITGYEEPA